MGYAPEIEKALSLDKALIKLVRPAGIEPTTPWFVARYSNPTELRAHGADYSKKSRNGPFESDE